MDAQQALNIVNAIPSNVMLVWDDLIQCDARGLTGATKGAAFIQNSWYDTNASSKDFDAIATKLTEHTPYQWYAVSWESSTEQGVIFAGFITFTQKKAAILATMLAKHPQIKGGTITGISSLMGASFNDFTK